MKRIALMLGGLLASVLAASPLAALTLTWTLADPAALAAYHVGSGVVIVASGNTCLPTKLVADTKPFVYDYELGSRSGLLCLTGASTITAYYQAGSPAKVTVKTKSRTVMLTVLTVPPTNPAIGHLPFH